MRLIDADALIQKRRHAKDYSGEMYVIGQGYVMDAPTIEPKRGEWVEPDENDITTACICSLCDWRGHIMEDDVMGMPYCPNCGADMRGKEKAE